MSELLVRQHVNNEDRRTFLGALAGAVISAALSTFAQQPSFNLRRIGFLGSESASNQANRLEALREGLRDLGDVEGKNLVMEVRGAEGNYDRLPTLAAELVGLKVSVVVTSGAKAARAMTRATTTIPIVVETGDAVALGVVTNLARPGGNVTGWTFFGPESTAKRLELLKEAIPSVTQSAYLVNVADPPSVLQGSSGRLLSGRDSKARSIASVGSRGAQLLIAHRISL